ncbi:MAG: hypothetical protein M1814_005973 [Vezdaea aestivalis]|nr:MAG: hypothetical protein M1814_005973 [Vezdaea aestivalis]
MEGIAPKDLNSVSFEQKSPGIDDILDHLRKETQIVRKDVGFEVLVELRLFLSAFPLHALVATLAVARIFWAPRQNICLLSPSSFTTEIVDTTYLIPLSAQFRKCESYLGNNMNSRSYESPMDFEWQHGGPQDPSSPFRAHNVQHHINMQTQRAEQDRVALKRSHSVFDSPEKKTVPVLREPDSQPFLFNSPPAPLSSLPPSFRTPRKIDLDFSSGPEPASSPDADTPDLPGDLRSRQPNFLPAGGSKVSAADFQLRLSAPNKSGRGPYSYGALSKVHRRRERQNDLQRYIDDPNVASWDGQEVEKPLTFWSLGGRFFAWINSNPNLPGILENWITLSFDVLMFGFILVFAYSVWSTVGNDIALRNEEAESVLVASMAVCAKHFAQNKCDAVNRVPALEEKCEEWSRCMNLDPRAVNRSKVGMAQFSIIISEFIDTLSQKALVCHYYSD